MGVSMALIIVRANETRTALESILHVLKLQFDMGHKILTLNIKHRDGTREWLRGSLDTVLKSDNMLGVEYRDLIMLEHYNDRAESYTVYMEDSATIETIKETFKNDQTCCVGMMPRMGPHLFFIFKNDPMSSYDLMGNNFISHRTPKEAVGPWIMNNICGKITCDRGLFHTMGIL